MTTRDRLVLVGIVSLAVLAGAWLLLVSPERKKAATLSSEVKTAQAQLVSAEAQVADARGAQTRYAAAYASIVSLGKAVPAGREVPSLIYQLAHASNQKDVEFNSIVAGSGSPGSSGASSSAAAAAPTALAGFTQMPFTFVFNGSYEELYHLFQSLNRSAVRTSSGALVVSGRLLTIQGAKLAPAAAEGEGKDTGRLSGTITATAYVLPATEGLTSGATAASPAAGATTAAASTAAASATSTPAALVGARR